MKTKILIFALFLTLSQTAFAQNVDISGFARNYTGALYNTGEFIMLQNTLNLNFEKTGSKVAFKANPMLYLYDIDSLDFRIREIYLDQYFNKLCGAKPMVFLSPTLFLRSISLSFCFPILMR